MRSGEQDNRITSQIAGALWEWPPAVCGRHTDIISLENFKRWYKVAYDRYKEMAANPELSVASGEWQNFSSWNLYSASESDVLTSNCRCL